MLISFTLYINLFILTFRIKLLKISHEYNNTDIYIRKYFNLQIINLIYVIFYHKICFSFSFPTQRNQEK